MEVNQRSGIYHRTTIDTARVTYPTVSRVGQKRTFDEARGDGKTESPVLRDVTNRVEFRRPTLHNDCYPPLRAAGIIDVTPKAFLDYSQRKALALTPGPTSNPLLDLSHSAYDLPEGLVRNFAALGIKSIYPWQSECLLRSGALGGKRNLVYTAPTGGGKSLVADILMLKKIIEHPEKKALLVLPYVALVQEKLRWLRKVVEGVSKNETSKPPRDSKWRKRGDEDNVRIAGFFAGSKSRITWADMDIAVCTIEKVCSNLA
jgi:DNA polymerase theta